MNPKMTKNKTHNDLSTGAKIKTKLRVIFTNPVFLAGIVIRILAFWYTMSLGTDLNDMNEVLLLAIRRLFEGENPYEYGYEYTLSLFDHTYQYHFGYPPVAIFAYLPVLLYPETWGVWDFNIVMFIMNLIFDFLCVYLFTEKRKPFANYTMAVYWAIPIFSYADYVTFFSFMYLLIFLAFYYRDDPLKSSLFLFLSVGSYHLLIVMIPALIIYYLRDYLTLEESVSQYKSEFEKHGNKKFTSGEILEKSFSRSTLKRATKRGFEDIKDKLIPVAKKVLIGIVPTLLMFLPFILWDFAGFKYHLFDASASRYSLGSSDFKLIVLLLTLFVVVALSAVGQFLIQKKYLADCWLLASQLLIFFFEALYLVVSLNAYPHYFALMIPFAFHLIMIVWYKFRAYRVLRNEELPGIKNENE